MKKYVLGLDFGTLSVRAVIVDTLSGEELSESVCAYPHGVMDKLLPDGTPLPPQSATEHPQDYIDCMKKVIADALEGASMSACELSGVGVDFTACTLLAVDENAVPLCMYDEFKSDANAYAKLWKSHSADAEAKHIFKIAKERGEHFLDYCGGDVSSEWVLPKILQTLNNSPSVYERTYKFVEAGNWIVWLLTGRLVSAPSFIGFKGLWSDEDGFPCDEFLSAVDSRLSGLVGDKLDSAVISAEGAVGYVTKSGAELFGLCEGIAVSPAIIDAHAGMPAIGIKGDGELMMILGTSGCYIINSHTSTLVKTAPCTKGAVFDKLYTYEQGQCCFGDGFDWFVENFVPESYVREARNNDMSIHKYLRTKAQGLKIGESGLIVLDWFNGNRSVLADSQLTGTVLGLTLTTKPEEIYRAIIEAAVFGARMVIENYVESGIEINSIIASGGIALKDEMLMQIFADVLGREIKVSSAKQACALGSAMYASVAAGIYGSLEAAVGVMSKPVARVYKPISENTLAYEALYEEYKQLHDYFGAGGNDVMKRLLKYKHN